MFITATTNGRNTYIVDSKAELIAAECLASCIIRIKRWNRELESAAKRLTNLIDGLSIVDAQTVNIFAQRVTEDLGKRAAYMELLEEMGTDHDVLRNLCNQIAMEDIARIELAA